MLDPSGEAIAGAEARLVNQVSKDTRIFSTSVTGDFVFADVQPGTYTIQVKVSGFKQFEKSNIELTSNDSISAGELKLQIGAVTETVEVKAEGAQVQTASAERSGCWIPSRSRN